MRKARDPKDRLPWLYKLVRTRWALRPGRLIVL